MSKLSILLPVPLTAITQGFAENATIAYKRDGLIGHTAQDWAIPHGNPVPNCAENAYCYSVLHRGNPDLMKYRSVFTLVEGDNGVSDLAEVSYGHFDQITAEVGKTYQPGEILGTAGNTGTVFSGKKEVTAAQKNAGSKAGTHLHGPQIRPVRRVNRTSKGKTYLYDGYGIYRKDGYYFEVINYENGTNGCINPAPFQSGRLASDYAALVAKQRKTIFLLSTVLDLYKRMRSVK